MNSSDKSTNALALTVLCQVEQEKLQALVMLLNELTPLVPIPTTEHFAGVIVVPDDQREHLINELMKKI
jgi:hypothetical protein